MWQTILAGTSKAEVEKLTRFAFGGSEGFVDGEKAQLTTVEMDNNGALIMLQAKLSIGDRYLELTAFNTDSSNAQPRFGPTFRIDHIEIGRTEDGKPKEKQIYKAPPAFGRSVTKLFNATGLRNEITPLQMEATATVLSFVLAQFRAKQPVRFADIAAVFTPQGLKKLPPVSAWRLHAGTMAPMRRNKSPRRKASSPTR